MIHPKGKLRLEEKTMDINKVEISVEEYAFLIRIATAYQIISERINAHNFSEYYDKYYPKVEYNTKESENE